MTQHVFVAMPFGTKDGVDFNRVYRALVQPSLEGEGFRVLRADQEELAGNIQADMFQELLLADLVVADLSIDNPNVWYELGVRHALRARGIVLIQGKRERMPFDIYTDRTLRYHLRDGVPDPDFLASDRSALASMAKATIASWHGKKISPVYYHLPYLKEPSWKDLRVGGADEFWNAHDAWEARVRAAQKKNRPGDIIVLAAEAPVHALQEEACRRAGKSLLKLGQYAFSLEQYEAALTMNPDDLESLQQKGVLLGRLKKYGEARVLLERLASKNPGCAESLALLGRVEKDAWVNAWRKEGMAPADMRTNAAAESALLREAMHTYIRSFQLDASHCYSGINAVTLMHLHRHLTAEDAQAGLRSLMEGGLRWHIESALACETPDCKDFWARVTRGDLEVLVGEREVVARAYRCAVAAAGNDWFALDSSRQQLQILSDLEFRPEEVRSALAIFDQAIERITPPWRPRKVILFTGHMIDAPGRTEPRFPPSMEARAALAIRDKLKELDAGPADLALCGGACGGDLLFAEACLQRGLRLEVRIPFSEAAFLARSVDFAGDRWRTRYLDAKKHALTELLVMPDELGPAPADASPYARNNLWQLYSALSWGADKLHLLCLWNRKGGDGPGGTQHLHDEARRHAAHVHVLDTNILFKESAS